MRRAGREVAHGTLGVACLAREIIDRYGVKPKKSATLAAWRSVRKRYPAESAHVTLAAVQRALEGLDAAGAKHTGTGEKFVEALITPGFIDDAMSQLPSTARYCGWVRTPAAPPFTIAICRLSDPEDADRAGS